MGRESYLPLFFGDFLASTYTWGGEEQALYLLLLGYQWVSGPLPADPARLAKAVRYDGKRFIKLWETVRCKFDEVDGGLVNARLEEHRQHAHEIAEKRAAAGAKGGRPVKQTETALPKQKESKRKAKGFDLLKQAEKHPSIHPSCTSLRSVGVPGLDEQAWDRWHAFRADIRKPIRPASEESAMRALAKFGADQAAVVEQSIANGWQGLFALKGQTFHGKPLAVVEGGGNRIPTEAQREESDRKATESAARSRGIDPTGLTNGQIDTLIWEHDNAKRQAGAK